MNVEQQNARLYLLGRIGTLIAIAGVEYRVIFHSFAPYIAIPAPYSYIGTFSFPYTPI